jgi:hypothetical protein
MSVGLVRQDSVDSSLAPRLEAAVVTLRNRFEQHVQQEHRMQKFYLGLQDSWQSHLRQMASNMTMLEGLLATWGAAVSPVPQLSVVTGAESE